MAVSITQKPNFAVYGLGAPVRYANGSATRWMKIGWTVTEWQTSEDNKARATGVKARWTLDVSGKAANKDPRTILDLGNTSHVSSHINLNNLKIGKKTYARTSFYPFTDKKLYGVTAEVILNNSMGDATVTAKATRKFSKPKKPTISVPRFNAETGTVSATITTDAGLAYRERYDTRYTVSVYDSRTKTTKVTTDNSSTNTSIQVSHDVRGYQSLSYKDYVRVTIKAWSRGYAGRSDIVDRVFYVSYPSQATIKSIDVSSADSTGKVTARIDTNKEKAHPVDKVILEYLANVEYARAEEIAGDASWTTTQITDDGECTALAMPVAELIPDRGHYSWLRVKSYHAAEHVLYRYSNYKQLKQLHTPAATATNERIKILSAVASANGKSITVHLGWNKNGQDDATGTELSWADEQDAWKSTKDPTMYTFTWSDGAVTVDGVTYNDSATITIKGLNEGSSYYIRARRYYEGDTTSYSPYSNMVSCVPSEQPTSIVASCAGYIAVGEPLQVYWSLSGNGLQKEWQIVSSDEIYDYRQVVGATGDPSGQGYYELSGGSYVLTTDTEVDETKTYYEKVSFGTIIASGEGSLGSTQISAERLASFGVDSLTFTVQASTGSGFVVSEEHTVAIIEKPVIQVTANETLTQQPFSFSVTSSSASNLIVILSSQGASSQFPQGLLMQTDGDTIYSDVITPSWTEENGSFTTTVELPSGLDLWNSCNYELSIVAVDQTTGLKSEESLTELLVDYSYSAVAPTATVTPIDETDADGIHHMAVDITVTTPTGSRQTDVYDIYRMDNGKASLIGQSYPLDYSVRDEYAPFGDGDMKYRIALRTEDGDVQYKDFEYELPSEIMRFDWAGGALEFPYGLTISDGYSKDVEFRSHLDGNIDGYWRQNVDRKSSLGTSVLKLIQPNEIEMAGMLARYAGPVFVRLPNGAAYEADVQVSDMSVKNEAVTAIAIDATEIGLTDEFRLPIPYILEEDE